ncbi:MAG: aspartate carbamoyltransferase regulatory subunit [Vulcanimicrobiota bacterium]
MTGTKKEHMKIPKIEKGIVIDHIPVGRALLVAQAIGLDRVEQNGPVTLGLNFESRKMGKKDLIKVEHLELARQELEKIALLAPGSSVKSIIDFTVKEHIEIKPPDIVEGLLACHNPRCITNRERDVATRFIKVKERPLSMKCQYCERIYLESELELR